MNEIGSRLKEARQAKGLSLDNLQEMTKIQKRYLEAIEEGNFDIMPGAFYVRAFIKQYAEAVGLDAEELLVTYKLDVPKTSSEEVTQSIQTTPSRRKISRSSSNKFMENMPKIIVALFIIVLFVTFWILLQKKLGDDTPQEEETTPAVEYVQPGDNAAEEAPADDTTEDAAEEPAEEVVEEEPVEETPAQTIAPGEIQGDGVTTVYNVSGTETLNIRVEAAGLTWIGIRNTAGAEQVEARAYNAGEVVEHDSTANRYARIRLGDSTQAKVFVNDQEVPYAQTIVTQNIIIQLAE